MTDELLFDPASHERLTERAWDEHAVREAIARIAADAEAAFTEASYWEPHHPLDEIDAQLHRLKNLYLGASGVVWALHRLASIGAADPRRDLRSFAAALPARYREEPDAGEFEGPLPSLWLGEVGVLLVAHTLAPSKAEEDRLLDLVEGNRENPTWELVWGSPGTMLAAQVIHARTGDSRFAEAWRSSADRLWAEWRDDLWLQDLKGKKAHLLGPAHGFAGNVAVLARGDLLDPARRLVLERRAVAAILKYAVRRDGLAQWPNSLAPREGKPPAKHTQWCHGAPGIVASLASLAPGEEDFTAVLCEGGELVWRAGPLAKGAGLCHGTAGNGYALLHLFHRTGDERWLSRARRFAMHALEQVDRARATHGRGRYALWTGDVGTALYLHACIAGTPGFPTIDFF